MPWQDPATNLLIVLIDKQSVAVNDIHLRMAGKVIGYARESAGKNRSSAFSHAIMSPLV